MDIAFFSFIGIVVGAVLQYFFTRHLDHQRHLRDLRSGAYTDYLKCVCDHANLGETGGEAAARGLGGRTANAKSRVCLYGSASVVDAFAEFDQAGATMNTPQQRQLFARMVSLMRSDSGTRGAARLASIQTVLMGTRTDGT